MSVSAHLVQIGSQGYTTCFMLNSTEHEISTAHKSLTTENDDFSLCNTQLLKFIMQINVKMPTIYEHDKLHEIVGIISFISLINYNLS